MIESNLFLGLFLFQLLAKLLFLVDLNILHALMLNIKISGYHKMKGSHTPTIVHMIHSSIQIPK